MRRRHAQPRTNWTGWTPHTTDELAGVRREVRRWARLTLTAFLMLAAAAAYGLWDGARSRESACRHLNDTRAALRTIIARGDRNLAKFLHEHAITKAQYDRSLTESASARHQLRRIRCTRA